jgi:dihydropteroate synthase
LSYADLAGRLYVGPAGTLSGSLAAAAVVSGQGWSLAGGPLAFALCSVALREGARVFESVAPFAELLDWSEAEGDAVARHVGGVLKRLGANRPDFAGLSLDRPRLMGIVNVTPDSFSDGGRYADTERAVAHGLALLEAGADILDIGGESTRPGGDPVSPDEEARRVLPVVRALTERGAVVSIDTRHAAVMVQAVAAGAAIINDISALEGDPQALRVAAESRAAVILMHMQGDPRTMQQAPVYACAPLDVFDYLAGRLVACEAAGIPRAKLCVDPGIGFGKTVEHNCQILARLGLYHGLGVPVLLGVSRKRFIAGLSRGEPATARLAGSLAAGQVGLDAGCQILRVHDVAETAQMAAVWRGMRLG